MAMIVIIKNASETDFDNIILPPARPYLLYVDIAISVAFLGCSGLLGVFSNVVNILVFAKQGLSDCVSVCLFALAISDLGTSLMAIVYSSSKAFILSGLYFYADPSSFSFIALWVLVFCCDLTMFVTVFISVERSLCVLMPFHFKNLITRNRAIIVTAVISCCLMACYLPIFLSFGLFEGWDATYNTTRLLLWLSNDRGDIETFLNIFLNITSGFACQTIVIASTVGMVLGLRRSTKFQSKNRQTSSSKSTSEGAPESSDMSKKSVAVIKMVTYFAVIFVGCNAMRLAMVICRRLDPDIDVYHEYRNLYHLYAGLYFSASSLNSSVNIFVYYRFKPNFKSVLAKMVSI